MSPEAAATIRARAGVLGPAGADDPCPAVHRPVWPHGKDTKMEKSVAKAAGVIILCFGCGARAQAQGDVLFPGSTAPGDVLRGEGVASKGVAVLYLNAAKARSIDADTQV